MNSSKAKKAKTKAKTRTSNTALAQAIALQQAAMNPGAINPEVQSAQIAMQDRTQSVNPYHMMGAMPPNMYNPGNVVHGGFIPGS